MVDLKSRGLSQAKKGEHSRGLFLAPATVIVRSHRAKTKHIKKSPEIYVKRSSHRASSRASNTNQPKLDYT